jgi:hypothetical protein
MTNISKSSINPEMDNGLTVMLIPPGPVSPYVPHILTWRKASRRTKS